ncbi:MAG: ABC transporter substrate-binding protein [Synergistaceae bacterium]|jgi:branched-chain amino acid transport system substrate-binding protein|nr:ABC transporter substrate-binding protein [Synergistaceae bacterium]
MKTARFRQNGFLVLCLTALFLSLLACGTSSAADEKVIRIGAIFPLTGPAAVSGQNCLAAVQTAADIINGKYAWPDFPLAEKEGLLDGYRIEIVAADHQGKPDIAKSEAERLYNQEKVFAVIGSYNSSSSKPASAVAERLKKIFLCGASSSAELTERGFNYFFRTAATDGIESKEFIDYIDYLNKNKDAGIKTLGFLYENSEFGKHAAEEGKRAAATIGLQIVADVPFTVGATNMNSEVQTLKSANPDAVFGAALGSDYSLMVRTMKQSSWVPKIFINYCTGYQNPSINNELGADGNFFMGGMGYSPEIAEVYMTSALPAQDIYRGKTGFPLDSDSIQEAVCLHVLAQAIEKAGALDTEKVAGLLRSETFPSPLSLSGQVAFDQGGQNNKAFTVITQIVDGKYRTVFPEDYADSQITYPFPAWDKR